MPQAMKGALDLSVGGKNWLTDVAEVLCGAVSMLLPLPMKPTGCAPPWPICDPSRPPEAFKL